MRAGPPQLPFPRWQNQRPVARHGAGHANPRPRPRIGPLRSDLCGEIWGPSPNPNQMKDGDCVRPLRPLPRHVAQLPRFGGASKPARPRPAPSEKRGQTKDCLRRMRGSWPGREPARVPIPAPAVCAGKRVGCRKGDRRMPHGGQSPMRQAATQPTRNAQRKPPDSLARAEAKMPPSVAYGTRANHASKNARKTGPPQKQRLPRRPRHASPARERLPGFGHPTGSGRCPAGSGRCPAGLGCCAERFAGFEGCAERSAGPGCRAERSADSG